MLNMQDKKNVQTIFLEACAHIAFLLNDKDFKVLKKGQVLKKVSVNKDLYYEIYFQTSHLNSASHISVLPHLNIYSKKLKEWKIKQSGNPDESGVIYSNTLGYICPCGYKKWNVAGISGDSQIKQIAELLNDFALPIFNLFDDMQFAIDFLKEQGTCFNKYTEKSLMPIGFMIYYASKADSEQFFNDFIENCSYRGKIISLYKTLEGCEDIDLNHSEFFTAHEVKLAFINGLKIKPSR